LDAKARSRKIYSACLAVSFVLLVVVVFLSSPFFEVAEVKTSGFSTAPDFNFKGKNIFSISAKKTKDEILKDPYIKEAVVTKEYPRVVCVSVLERKPIAYIKYSEDVFLYIDEEGVALEDGLIRAGILENAAIITGLPFSKPYVIGEKVPESDYALELLNLFIKNDFAVSKIELTESGDVNFYLGNAQFIISGSQDLEFKIKKAKKILEALGDVKALINLETDIVSKAN
jgi:cell division septal protein FtsQ